MLKVSKSSSKKTISVFIPTYNGEKYIASTLDSLINQILPKDYELEILVTDSGSKDKTLEILDAYKDQITLDIIPNKEFGHGKTRQRAAQKAKGEFILFLTQDATPTSHNWIIDMIEPFYLSDSVGCVYGRQIPRPDVAPTIKREVSEVFNRFGPEDAIMIHRKFSLIDGAETQSANNFLSDVNSAFKRRLLVEDVPFRDLDYSEDQAIALDIFNKKMLKAYSSRGAVWHSNEYTANEYYHRKFDEYIGLQESVKHKFTPSRKELIFAWIKPTLHDWKFILKDKDYSLFSKCYWLLLSPFYNFANFAGKYQAIKHFDDINKRTEISLEYRRKK